MKVLCVLSHTGLKVINCLQTHERMWINKSLERKTFLTQQALCRSWATPKKKHLSEEQVMDKLQAMAIAKEESLALVTNDSLSTKAAPKKSLPLSL